MNENTEKINRYIKQRAREARERLGLDIDDILEPDGIEEIIKDQQVEAQRTPFEAVITPDKVEEVKWGVREWLVSPVSVCLTYLIAIVFAEALTVLVSSLSGVVFYFAVLLLMVINATIADTPATRRLFLVLGLVPLIRIMSIAIPEAEFSDIYWYIIISVPVIVGILAVAQATRFKLSEIGLNMHKWHLQLMVATTGIGFGIVEYLILKPEAMIEELTFGELIVPALILIVATGLVEELAFRGIIQRAAQGVITWGWVFVAFLYTALYIGHISALHCLLVLAIALFYGWVVKQTKSIIGVGLSRGLMNVGLFLVYPFIL